MPTADAKVEEIKRSSQNISESNTVDINSEKQSLKGSSQSKNKTKKLAFSMGLVSGIILTLCFGAIPVYFNMDSTQTMEQTIIQSKEQMQLLQDNLREEKMVRKSLEIEMAHNKLKALEAQINDIKASEEQYQELLANKSKLLSKKLDNEKIVEKLFDELSLIKASKVQ